MNILLKRLRSRSARPRPRLWGSSDVVDADLARVRADLAGLELDHQRDERSREEPGRARRRSLRSDLRAALFFRARGDPIWGRVNYCNATSACAHPYVSTSHAPSSGTYSTQGATGQSRHPGRKNPERIVSKITQEC